MRRFKFNFRIFFLVFTIVSSAVHLTAAAKGDTDRSRLDQIVLAAENLRGATKSLQVNSELGYGGKCGLWLSFEVARNWNAFTEGQKLRLRQLMSAPTLQKDRVIGRFHIFYDTTGLNAPALITIDPADNCQRIPGSVEQFVDSVGKYFNLSWEYEIDTLGYAPPPLAADGFYPVNILEENTGLFGLYGETVHNTNPINVGTPSRFATFINIDNDFCEIFSPSRGMPALKVTAAHEFHHAIQLGSYGEWSSDYYFYEITSTWMEDVVFDDVNDYYQYLKFDQPFPFPPVPRGQFANPDLSFTSFSGLIPYSRAIWGKFIEKRYSRDVMRFAWEHIAQVPPLQAMDQALESVGSSFRQAFLEWGIWNSHTYSNSDTIKYYTEGKQYPPIVQRARVEYYHTPRSFEDSIQALSTVYHPICLIPSASTSCDLSPQMLVIISNIDIVSGFSGEKRGFTYEMTDNGDGSYKKLSNGVFVRLNVPDPQNWLSQETIPSVVSEVVVYPNPYYAAEQTSVKFRLPAAAQQIASLSIFSSSMNQVFSGEVNVDYSTPFEPKIAWNGIDNDQSIISSGVYFYFISADNQQYSGKFTVIRK